MSAGPKRKVVLGLGNTLNRDEGLGIHALKALEATAGSQTAVEYLDGGTLGLSLLPIVETCSHLLLLDATNAGQSPGTLIRLEKEQIPLYAGVRLSQHQVTFLEVLGLANMRGKLPQYLYLLGAQPADISMGVELSPTVEAVIPQIVEQAVSILRNWGVLESAYA